MKKIFGNIINPINKHKIDFIKDACLIINNNGIIEKTGIKTDFTTDNYEIIDFGENFIIPGFIDIHTHIPQYPMIGKGRGELLEWLKYYIFPAEIKFNNTEYVKKVFSEFLNNSLKYGTTTSLAFSSIHKNALEYIIDNSRKIRLFAGNSLMDSGVGELIKPIEENLKVMNDLYLYSKSEADFNYIVTPRYAGNCSFELLKKSAQFAKENNLMIQTHLSENINEINHIMNLHPDFKNYTEIYFKSGILSETSILAHCIHLSEHEIEMVSKSGAIVAHCPTSNIYLKSGIMPLKKYLQSGLKVAFGTDVAGGYSLDIKTEMRNAIESSKILSYFLDDDLVVSPKDVFPLSNIMAAEYLNISDMTGNLNPGKYADFTVVKNKNSSESIDDILSEIIYGEEKENLATFYKGKRVH